MSAIGSVIVMAWWPSSPSFPSGPAAWAVGAGGAQVDRGRGCALGCWPLPAGLGDAGQFAAVGHGAQADPAQPELAVHRAWPPAARAPGIGLHAELRLPVCLGDQRLRGHGLALLERESEPPQ